ncbi:helix-turn-helix domain-containing protein [Embleya sp. MST-111070]|uniref:helix-turn-helix domain-containing protein n=1 Tax=Embleya sp. MST-111070 TaxID=3398231 RepID=UPI003F7406AA
MPHLTAAAGGFGRGHLPPDRYSAAYPCASDHAASTARPDRPGARPAPPRPRRAAPAEIFASRQWSADEWAADRERLAARGRLDADGTATEVGRTGGDSPEALTDELAAQPLQALGATRAAHLGRPGPA